MSRCGCRNILRVQKEGYFKKQAYLDCDPGAIVDEVLLR